MGVWVEQPLSHAGLVDLCPGWSSPCHFETFPDHIPFQACIFLLCLCSRMERMFPKHLDDLATWSCLVTCPSAVSGCTINGHISSNVIVFAWSHVRWLYLAAQSLAVPGRWLCLVELSLAVPGHMSVSCHLIIN